MRLTFYICLFLVVFGKVCQSISAPLWYHALQYDYDAYAILFQTSLVYAPFFVVSLLVFLLVTGRCHFYFRNLNFFSWKDQAEIAMIGFVNSLNGVFAIYASPANRNPPGIVSLISNLNAITVLFMNKVVRCDERRYTPSTKYVQDWYPSITVILNLCSVVLVFIPSAFSNKLNPEDEESTWYRLYWMAMIFLGLNFGILYNVMQKKYLDLSSFRAKIMDEERTERGTDSSSGSIHQHKLLTKFHLLAFQGLYLHAFNTLFFWTDLIPNFGNANSLSHLKQINRHSLLCSFGIPDDYNIIPFSENICVNALFWSLVFNGGYILTFWSNLFVNEIDPTFTGYMSIFVTLIVIIMGYLYTPLNPDPERTTWYFILPAFLLCTCSIIIFERWAQWSSKKERGRKRREGDCYSCCTNTGMEKYWPWFEKD